MEKDEMTKIVNLTGHNINVKTDDPEMVVFKPSGQVLRLGSRDEIVDMINGTIPIIRRIFTEPRGFEIPIRAGTYYIVPNQIMSVMQRPDFIAPDTRNGAELTASVVKRADGDKLVPNVKSVKRMRVFDVLEIS
jgi:hypothetical protein